MTLVGKTEFSRIKAAARKAKREANALFIATVAATARPGEAETRPIAPDARKRAKAKIKRNRPISQKAQIKTIKKRILCSGGTWSQAVRKRDGRCLLCGSTQTLQAHHWLYSRSRSVALSVEISNGATLCYGCHIGKIHREATGAYFRQLFAVMVSILGQPEIDRMDLLAKETEPLGLEFWQKADERVKAFNA